MTPREILLEFSKGCSCGGPGECEPCLDGALSALEKEFKSRHQSDGELVADQETVNNEKSNDKN